jgi:hypothetical protein
MLRLGRRLRRDGWRGSSPAAMSIAENRSLRSAASGRSAPQLSGRPS